MRASVAGPYRVLLMLLVIFMPVLVSQARADETLDRVIVTVDRHAILRSDIETEARVERLVSGEAPTISAQDEVNAVDRLVDRALISDQVAAFGSSSVKDADVDARLLDIRHQLPNAQTDSGWQALLQRYGITEEDVRQRIREELQTLRFLDMRFRSEVRVGPRSIQTYYDTKLVPELKKKNVAPPPLEEVQDKIEEILRQERVNTMIADWVKTLRSQSRIQSFDPEFPVAQLENKAPDLSDLRFLPLRINGSNSDDKRPK